MPPITFTTFKVYWLLVVGLRVDQCSLVLVPTVLEFADQVWIRMIAAAWMISWFLFIADSCPLKTRCHHSASKKCTVKPDLHYMTGTWQGRLPTWSFGKCSCLCSGHGAEGEKRGSTLTESWQIGWALLQVVCVWICVCVCSQPDFTEC